MEVTGDFYIKTQDDVSCINHIAMESHWIANTNYDNFFSNDLFYTLLA